MNAGRAYFAAYLDLRDRLVLVVGGGGVAEGKVETLLRSGARVRVVSPRLRERLAAWVRDGVVEHRPRAYEPRDLDGTRLAIAATDDPLVNASVARVARERGIPVNVGDDPALSTFIMPAVVDRGPVQIAVSTAGASPVLAKHIAALVAEAVPEAYGRLATFVGHYRAVARRHFPDVAARRAFWQDVIHGPIARHVLEGREREARELIEAELQAAQARKGEPHNS